MTLQQDFKLLEGDYAVHLDLIAKIRGINSAEKFFIDLPDRLKGQLTWVTFSVLTSIDIENSRFEDGLLSVKEMEKRVCRKIRAGYSSVISLYTGLGKTEDVKRIWKKMKSTFRKLNDAEYSCMISSLIKLNEFEEAENLYAEWESASPTGDTRVPNLILAGYINRNDLKKAELFFQKRMVEKGIIPSYTSWQVLTYGYLHEKQTSKVLDCFKKALGSVKKWDPDEKFVNEAFKLVEEFGNVEGAEELLAILRNVGYVSTEIYNMVFKMYEKAGKMPLIVAERMKKDKVLLNEETRELIKVTSKMCVSEVSSYIS